MEIRVTPDKPLWNRWGQRYHGLRRTDYILDSANSEYFSISGSFILVDEFWGFIKYGNTFNRPGSVIF
jgi:hypothetical protein